MKKVKFYHNPIILAVETKRQQWVTNDSTWWNMHSDISRWLKINPGDSTWLKMDPDNSRLLIN